jgi:hypothetical protein
MEKLPKWIAWNNPDTFIGCSSQEAVGRVFRLQRSTHRDMEWWHLSRPAGQLVRVVDRRVVERNGELIVEVKIEIA